MTNNKQLFFIFAFIFAMIALTNNVSASACSWEVYNPHDSIGSNIQYRNCSGDYTSNISLIEYSTLKYQSYQDTRDVGMPRAGATVWGRYSSWQPIIANYGSSDNTIFLADGNAIKGYRWNEAQQNITLALNIITGKQLYGNMQVLNNTIYGLFYVDNATLDFETWSYNGGSPAMTRNITISTEDGIGTTGLRCDTSSYICYAYVYNTTSLDIDGSAEGGVKTSNYFYQFGTGTNYTRRFLEYNTSIATEPPSFVDMDGNGNLDFLYWSANEVIVFNSTGISYKIGGAMGEVLGARFARLDVTNRYGIVINRVQVHNEYTDVTAYYYTGSQAWHTDLALHVDNIVGTGYPTFINYIAGTALRDYNSDGIEDLYVGAWAYDDDGAGDIIATTGVIDMVTGTTLYDNNIGSARAFVGPRIFGSASLIRADNSSYSTFTDGYTMSLSDVTTSTKYCSYATIDNNDYIDIVCIANSDDGSVSGLDLFLGSPPLYIPPVTGENGNESETDTSSVLGFFLSIYPDAEDIDLAKRTLLIILTLAFTAIATLIIGSMLNVKTNPIITSIIAAIFLVLEIVLFVAIDYISIGILITMIIIAFIICFIIVKGSVK